MVMGNFVSNSEDENNSTPYLPGVKGGAENVAISKVPIISTKHPLKPHLVESRHDPVTSMDGRSRINGAEHKVGCGQQKAMNKVMVNSKDEVGTASKLSDFPEDIETVKTTRSLIHNYSVRYHDPVIKCSRINDNSKHKTAGSQQTIMNQSGFLELFDLRPTRENAEVPVRSPKVTTETVKQPTPVPAIKQESFPQRLLTEVELTSPLGQLALRTLTTPLSKFTIKHYIDKYEKLSQTLGLELFNRLRGRHPSYPIIFKHKKRNQAYTHRYCFNSWQRHQQRLFLKTGLNRRSRLLLARCKPLKVVVDHLPESVVANARRNIELPENHVLEPVQIKEEPPHFAESLVILNGISCGAQVYKDGVMIIDLCSDSEEEDDDDDVVVLHESPKFSIMSPVKTQKLTVNLSDGITTKKGKLSVRGRDPTPLFTCSPRTFSQESRDNRQGDENSTTLALMFKDPARTLSSGKLKIILRRSCPGVSTWEVVNDSGAMLETNSLIRIPNNFASQAGKKCSIVLHDVMKEVKNGCILTGGRNIFVTDGQENRATETLPNNNAVPSFNVNRSQSNAVANNVKTISMYQNGARISPEPEDNMSDISTNASSNGEHLKIEEVEKALHILATRQGLKYMQKQRLHTRNGESNLQVLQIERSGCIAQTSLRDSRSATPASKYTGKRKRNPEASNAVKKLKFDKSMSSTSAAEKVLSPKHNTEVNKSSARANDEKKNISKPKPGTIIKGKQINNTKSSISEVFSDKMDTVSSATRMVNVLRNLEDNDLEVFRTQKVQEWLVGACASNSYLLTIEDGNDTDSTTFDIPVINEVISNKKKKPQRIPSINLLEPKQKKNSVIVNKEIVLNGRKNNLDYLDLNDVEDSISCTFICGKCKKQMSFNGNIKESVQFHIEYVHNGFLPNKLDINYVWPESGMKTLVVEAYKQFNNGGVQRRSQGNHSFGKISSRHRMW